MDTIPLVMSVGHARNVTEIAINARIAAAVNLYQTDAFAEYNNDAFQLVLENDDESGEDWTCVEFIHLKVKISSFLKETIHYNW